MHLLPALPLLLSLGASAAAAQPLLAGFLAALSPSLPPSSLPAPPANQTLQLIALGLGYQNYSCAAAGAAPVAIGAVATLYDATAAASVSRTDDTLTCMADKSDSSLGLRTVGKHYFTGAGVPTFDLSSASRRAQGGVAQGLYLSAKKMNAAAAPTSACAGRDGGAAVPWLMLEDRGDGLSRGVKSVYRVRTTGGSAPACGAAGVVRGDYAAEYWFYA